MKIWFIWVGSVIAAVAAVIASFDKILSFVAKWLAPHVSSYFGPKATIFVLLDTDRDVQAMVFAADPKNENHAIEVDRTKRGQKAMLTVPANYLYTIGWTGDGIEAGTTEGVLAVKGESLFHLVRTGGPEDQIKLNLRRTDRDQAELPATEPSARLLLSARAVQAVSDPAISISAGTLPELDRAAAIVGLFETGTTDCARRLFFVPAFGPSRSVAPAIGCLGSSIPGWLADTITSLDDGDAHRLDVFLGGNADLLRNYVRDWRAVPQEAPLREAMERLITAPEFWIKYQFRVLAAYAQATDAARQIGLSSERGRLLLFDRLVHGGPGAVARGIRDYAERYPEGAANRPANEAARIRALGEILKAQGPPSVAASVARRVDTIVSGHGSIRGITFDLDQLGVSDEVKTSHGMPAASPDSSS